VVKIHTSYVPQSRAMPLSGAGTQAIGRRPKFLFLTPRVTMTKKKEEIARSSDTQIEKGPGKSAISAWAAGTIMVARQLLIPSGCHLDRRGDGAGGGFRAGA